ncbi:type IV pilus modification PilV family protein [Vibrio brasiliensis]|uniref:Putative type IV pilin n=1 Tax=Vibrio brasiliensis LMG 20546 TaxID=945543 RepID=E8LS58_9VIBR|nr:prepilin-type N-terminal cleavage/methylation domain-containing protein [Vibrio brasiliensis]EGA66475.1 putative type IV pilin [Vibrio brasiliensis LMG 20546]
MNRYLGFSLIEVMVALFITAVASFALVQLQVYVQQRFEFAIKGAKALNLAEQKLEWLRSSPELSSEFPPSESSLPVSDSVVVDDSSFVVRLQLENDSVVAKLYRVNVEVEWLDRLGEPHSVRLTTMLSTYSESIGD